MLLLNGSTSKKVMLLLVSALDHLTGKTGASPTVTVSKNGGAFGALAGSVAEVGSGWYAVTLAAGDVDTNGELILHAEATAADPADKAMEVIAADVFDAVALGLSRIDAAISSRLASGSYTAPPSAAAIRAEIDSNSSKLDATVSSRASAVALAVVQADTDDIQTRLPAALVGGKIDSHVNDIAANAITAASMAADASQEIRAEMDANSTKLANLDATVSSRLATVGYTAPPSVGAIRAEIDANSTKLDAAVSSRESATDPRLDHLDADVSSRASGTEIATVDGDVLAVGSAVAALSIPTAAAIRAEIDSNSTKLDVAVSTRATPGDIPAAPSVPTANQNADALLDRASAIDGKTPRQALRYIAATTVGESSGDPNDPVEFMSLDGVTTRVRTTLDAHNNRVALELDPV